MQIEYLINLLWLLLLVPVAVLILVAINWKKKLTERLGENRLILPLMKSYSSRKFLLKGLLSMAAISLLALALTNMRKPDSTEKVRLTGTDLMIALDVSNSMMAKDIPPNRLEKSKLLISKLIDQLEGNRMGLVVFAGNAYLQMPLTTDASAARLFLSTISPDLVPLQGTNISDALKLCNRSLNNEDKKYKSILLISDGEDHDDAAISTAKELKNYGVVINTVGVGSPAGSPIADPATNEMKRDDQGNVVMTKLNEKELRDIAVQSHGTYQLLDEADAAAKLITDQLRGMDKKPITDTTLTNYTSYYWIFGWLAFLALLVELLISEKKSSSGKNLKDKTSTNNMVKEKNISKAALLSLLMSLFYYSGFSQKENELLRKGNEAYQQQKFDEAGKQYEAALKQNSANEAANFNLANTRFKSGKFDDAYKQYDALAGSAADKQIQAKSLYNKGVSLVKQKKLQEAVDAFKQSLRQDPKDEETRQNLQKALNDLKQQQQQQQKDKKDEKKDPKKKEDKKDEPKKDPKEDQKQQEKQQQQPKPKINKEDAEQKLQALRQEEKKLQQKMNQRQKTNVRQPEKDW